MCESGGISTRSECNITPTWAGTIDTVVGFTFFYLRAITGIIHITRADAQYAALRSWTSARPMIITKVIQMAYPSRQFVGSKSAESRPDPLPGVAVLWVGFENAAGPMSGR